MNKEDWLKKFEKNVAYLQKNIPPDDIYVFAEQTFMSSMFFLSKWSDWIDIEEEMEKDPVVEKWVNNIVGLQKLKDLGQDVNLDLNYEERQ